jgi:hypothetical protein
VGATELPTQGDAAVAGIDPIDYINKQLQDILKPPSTEDYLAVSAAIKSNALDQCPEPVPLFSLFILSRFNPCRNFWLSKVVIPRVLDSLEPVTWALCISS